MFNANNNLVRVIKQEKKYIYLFTYLDEKYQLSKTDNFHVRRRIGAIRKNELTSETRGKERSTIDTKSALKEKKGGMEKMGAAK